MLATRPGDHIGTTFASRAEFTATTVAFTEQAISAAGQVVIFPGGADRDDLAGFQRHLGAQSPAVSAGLARGQVQVADSRQMQLATGGFDPAYLRQAYSAATAQAVSAGYQGLWVSVDMHWAAEVDPIALADFEASSFPLFTGGQLTALCQYDERTFPATTTSATCSAHPAAPDSRRPLRHQRPRPDTLRLDGETDLSNHGAFTALVRSLRRGDTVDITTMTFVDLQGLVAIADQQRRLGDLTVRATGSQSNLLALIRAATDYPLSAR